MSAQHTRGRLEVAATSRSVSIMAGSFCVAQTATIETGNVPPAEANARRLVACWNACEGIPTELIEKGGFAAVPVETHREVKSQRDELLTALYKMNRAYVRLLESGKDRIETLGGKCDPVDVMEANDPNLRESRAAIAKAKGGAA